MITFQNVAKAYNGHPQSAALEGITFKINPNEFVSLVGRSGAGKSTIIRLLIGEIRPTRGRITFGPYEVNKLKEENKAIESRIKEEKNKAKEDAKIDLDKLKNEQVKIKQNEQKRIK